MSDPDGVATGDDGAAGGDGSRPDADGPVGGDDGTAEVAADGVSRYAFALGPLGAASLWGGMYVVSKWGFGLVPPLTLGFLRVALGGLVLVAVVRTRDEHVAREDYPRLAVLGGFVAATIATQFVGTDLTTASQGSLLTVLTPVFTVGLGAAVLGESLDRRSVGGTAVATLGTVLVVAARYDLATVAADNLLGVGLLVLSSVCWAGFTVWGAPVVRRYGALTATTYATLFSAPLLGLGAAVEWLVVDPSLSAATSVGALFAVAYLGVAATAAAWYLWYKGLEYVAAGTVAVFFFVQPVVGTALGVVLLGESVGPLFLVGGAVMAAGVYVASSERA